MISMYMNVIVFCPSDGNILQARMDINRLTSIVSGKHYITSCCCCCCRLPWLMLLQLQGTLSFHHSNWLTTIDSIRSRRQMIILLSWMHRLIVDCWCGVIDVPFASFDGVGVCCWRLANEINREDDWWRTAQWSRTFHSDVHSTFSKMQSLKCNHLTLIRAIKCLAEMP